MSRKIIRQGTEDVPIEYFYTEISAKNVDKWNTIEFLAQKMNILPEEMVAIGDNINDIKMINNAGLGVAMGQSSPKVQEMANYITKTNLEDGVSYAIESILADVQN